MLMAYKLAAGTNLLDDLHSHVPISYINTADYLSDHFKDLIIHNKLGKIKSHAHVQHACPIDQIRATLGSKETCEGFFVSSLGIGYFAVCLPTGYKTG